MIALMLLACAAHGPAGDGIHARGLRPALSTAEALSQALAPQRHALLIGVDDYTDPAFTDLKHAVHDAEALAEVLGRRDGGFDTVTALTDPADTTRDAVFRALQAAQRSLRSEDVLVVYFSGHGTRLRDGERWRRFLVTSDSQSTHLDTTAIDLATLQAFFSDLAPQRKALIVDACFNGDGKSAVRQPGELAPEDDAFVPPALTLGPGEAHLFATSPGRPSLEDDELGHGVYTWFLLEALSWGFAEADRDGDEVVTAWEAHDFARGRVLARTSALQVPEAQLRVVGEADVVLAGAPERRGARDRSLVYLYPRGDHALEGARLTVDGRERGALPGTVPIEPGRRHVALTGEDGAVLAEGYVVLQAGQVYRADDLARLVDGVEGGVTASAAAVTSPPLAAAIGAGAAGVELSAYKRMAEHPGRGQFVGAHLGVARSPGQEGSEEARGMGWVGAQVGYQSDWRRLRYRAGWSLSGIWIPPDRDRDTAADVDPLLIPEQAGWIFGATGPAVGAGWVLSSLLAVEANVRVEGALLDVEQTGAPALVPWVTAGVGAEANF